MGRPQARGAKLTNIRRGGQGRGTQGGVSHRSAVLFALYIIHTIRAAQPRSDAATPNAPPGPLEERLAAPGGRGGSSRPRPPLPGLPAPDDPPAARFELLGRRCWLRCPAPAPRRRRLGLNLGVGGVSGRGKGTLILHTTPQRSDGLYRARAATEPAVGSCRDAPLAVGAFVEARRRAEAEASEGRAGPP